MLAYIVRRLLYALPILIGVNLVTFALFFVVNTPDDMARMQLGVKRVTPEAIQKWKVERGYDKPLLWNSEAPGLNAAVDTIFFEKSARMFVGDFGRAEDGRDIAREIGNRMLPSLAIALPTFILGLFVTISFALTLAFFRATAFDFWGVVLCVAAMSISGLFYIIGGQYLISKVWRLVPISGFGDGLEAWRFLILPVLILYQREFYTANLLSFHRWMSILPVLIGVISGIGSSTRWYRTIFLEEVSKDYVRTARAKGLPETLVFFRHILRNAMIPILTGVVVVIPLLFMGSLLTESFFGIPGLGQLVSAVRHLPDRAGRRRIRRGRPRCRRVDREEPAAARRLATGRGESGRHGVGDRTARLHTDWLARFAALPRAARKQAGAKGGLCDRGVVGS